MIKNLLTLGLAAAITLTFTETVSAQGSKNAGQEQEAEMVTKTGKVSREGDKLIFTASEGKVFRIHSKKNKAEFEAFVGQEVVFEGSVQEWKKGGNIVWIKSLRAK